jgi:hypothetical protein
MWNFGFWNLAILCVEVTGDWRRLMWSVTVCILCHIFLQWWNSRSMRLLGHVAITVCWNGLTSSLWNHKSWYYKLDTCHKNLGMRLIYYIVKQLVYTDWLWARQPRGLSLSPGRDKIFLLSRPSRQALKPTHPPIRRVSWEGGFSWG